MIETGSFDATNELGVSFRWGIKERVLCYWLAQPVELFGTNKLMEVTEPTPVTFGSIISLITREKDGGREIQQLAFVQEGEGVQLKWARDLKSSVKEDELIPQEQTV